MLDSNSYYTGTPPVATYDNTWWRVKAYGPDQFGDLDSTAFSEPRFYYQIWECYCFYQSDFDEDGFITALDLGAMIDILFAGAEGIQDPGCPTSRADFDNNGFPDALDLGLLIDHLFVGGPPPCEPCIGLGDACAK
jgi:hypothetical protein